MAERSERSFRTTQGDRSREEILDVTSRIMSAQGYDGTSMSDISRETGLPNSSIYWHFRSKAALLAAVMERGAHRFFADVDAALARPLRKRAHGERMAWALQQAFSVFAQHEEFLRLFLVLLLSSADPEVSSVVARVRGEGRESIGHIFELAYADLGDAGARFVADECRDFALAVFDGAFVASQASEPVDRAKLQRQMAITLTSLGDSAAARLVR